MSGYLRAAIFDWAGTVIDFGSRAPMGAFVEAFRRFDVALSVSEARKPMGLPKRAHIAALMAEPAIAGRWASAHGTPPGEAEVDALYNVFVPLNTEVVADFCTLIPGAVAMAAAVRARGMKLGSTTGYVRPIMDRVWPLAAAQGYQPDNLVCAGDLADGRPTPLMMYRCFADLGVYPPSAVVKIDDTEPGILEGLAAGTWTVGVSISGNCVGLSAEEWAATAEEEQATLRARAEAQLLGVGAHFVIDSIADLMPVLDEIEARMARGEMP
jgi:phosphonoacetaldehyde hydrolase